MKNEFTLAFNEVLEEKGLPKEVILKALESAMISAYHKAVEAPQNQEVTAHVDPETGKVTIFAQKEVVESVENQYTEVALEDAQRYDPLAELGMLVMVESTPKDFGRVAAQTARQVIQQRIRDAERMAQVEFFEKQLGEIISGTVQAINSSGLTIGLEMRAEGSMPRKEMMGRDRFRIHDRVRALVAEVKDSPRGAQIILSRTHRDFLRRLLENEVPEIYHGVVEIRSIAREPGERAKVAVSATQAGIDPVGACVGIRGVRIQAIVKELNDEKIDVIEWNNDPAMFIAKALSPARVSGVYLNERNATGKTATVVVPEDQISLAIGRDGQNARLAAKLTGWRIDIKSVSEAAADSLHKLQSDPAYTSIAENESDKTERVVEILAKKAAEHPLTPEEYDVLSKFVERVEKRTIRKPEKRPESDADVIALRAALPVEAYDTNLLDSGLPDHVAYTLQENGFTTIGELALQMRGQPDDLLRLQGIGPHAMTAITTLLTRLEEQVIAEKAAAETAAAAKLVEIGELKANEEIAIEAQPLEIVAPSETEVPVMAGEPAAEEEDFNELFTQRPEPEVVAETEEEGEEGDGDKKGKKKKNKHVEIVYDPDRDLTIVNKKHKRGDVGWDTWEE